MIKTTERSLRGLRALGLIALAIAAGCASPSSRIGRLYQSLQSDVSGRSAGALPDPKIAERNAARTAEVRQMLDKGELKTAKDQFQASVILVESSDPADWKLSEQLAQQAAAGGERLAPRVAAEAIDRQKVFAHVPQRYGTQYEWVAVLAEWRLYPVDPATTDADRQAMGVPPLAEIYELEKKLNGTKPAR